MVVLELAPVVREVFQRRDRAATGIVELQAFLLEGGIERSVAGVASMLRSRMYLGEIHFGELHNPSAHEPIIHRSRLVRARAAAGDLARASGQVRAAVGAARCVALRDVRLADGDQQLQRQLPLR